MHIHHVSCLVRSKSYHTTRVHVIPIAIPTVWSAIHIICVAISVSAIPSTSTAVVIVKCDSNHLWKAFRVIRNTVINTVIANCNAYRMTRDSYRINRHYCLPRELRCLWYAKQSLTCEWWLIPRDTQCVYYQARFMSHMPRLLLGVRVPLLRTTTPISCMSWPRIVSYNLQVVLCEPRFLFIYLYEPPMMSYECNSDQTNRIS